MYKKKKLLLNIVNISFLILSLIELIKYFKFDNTLYGVIYLLINLIIIFLLLPVTFNYKRHYSSARISKIILIIIIGLFNSYILNYIVIGNMSYIDSSKNFIKSIFIIKNILKPILYFILVIFLFLETGINKKIKSSKKDWYIYILMLK